MEIYILVKLIDKFNKDISIEDLEYCNNIDDFIIYNSDYIFKTIDYINYYLEEYNKNGSISLYNYLLYAKRLLMILLNSNDTLEVLLYKFNNILRYDYKLRRFYVKIKVLLRT